ncbi:MAG: ribosome silencing factor [Nitrospirota bacterium]
MLGARTTLTDKTIAILAGVVARDKLADDVMVLDVAALTTVTSYLVIASGDSVRQVKAIAEAVDEALDTEGARLLRSEGLEHGRWVLLDYGGLVVHVFHREAREFYRIERLWADAPLIDLPVSRPDSRSARSPSSRDRQRLITPSEPG